MSSFSKLRTYWALGLSNVLRVAAYRLGLMTGLHPVQRLAAPVPISPFFRKSQLREDLPEANSSWDDALWWFGHHKQVMSDGTPDWFRNPFSDQRQPDAAKDWWKIPDFGSGDIKGLWELSRLDWLVAWSTKAAHGDQVALLQINLWLADWAQKNPPYRGPNWKCGQEASIRLMHLVTSAWILGQDRKPEQGLIDLLSAHLQRIEPTIPYAIGQQNNHGTSEAAALFIGGIFLESYHPQARKWAQDGRYWLENRAATLIEPDGSFSQYSVTYHRLMLDTYSLAEAWRRRYNLPAFSVRLAARLEAATIWLWAMTDFKTGDAPNLGSNDGARLLQLTASDYRDFRPSVQLAANLFCGADAFGAGPWNRSLKWLGIKNGSPCPAPMSRSFDYGGYHLLRVGSTMAVLRYPRYRFRPSQADALHLDLWFDGINLLRDAGTFSYNQKGGEWFSGTSAHNTITFDKRDQMPRLGRFLFADWIKAECVQPVRVDGSNLSAAAGYTDSFGAHHFRKVTLMDGGLLCSDIITGVFQEACLRWRLSPGNWNIKGKNILNESCSIAIEIDGTPVTPELGTTFDSRYYQQKEEIPEVLVIVNRPATIITKVTF